MAERVAIAYDCLYPVNTGGGERVYRRMAELFAESDCAVSYVTRRQWDDGAEPDAGFDVVPVWNGEIYDEHGTRTMGSAVGFAMALFRYFRRHRGEHDIVVVSALPVLNVFAVRLALLGTRAVIVTDWLEVWSWRKWRSYSGALVGTIASVLQWFGLRMGRLQTVNSSFTRERVRRYRPSADPIVLGLVDLVGEVADADTTRVGRPLAVFVGRHIADKRLDALPAAIAVARESVRDLTLQIVGTGPETAAVRARVHQLGLDDAVQFLGRVDDDALDRAFRSASVLVNPSAREGFGLVIAEAASVATPSVVVAGEDNAAAELVHDGVNGYVAASVGPDVLGAAIVRAIAGGAALRASTLGWFERERAEHGLAASVAQILERVRRG